MPSSGQAGGRRSLPSRWPLLLVLTPLALACDPPEETCGAFPGEGDSDGSEPSPMASGGSEEPFDVTQECELPEAKYEVEVIDPIAYGTQHGRQRMSAYLPVGVERAPVMIFVHGGSWRRGSRSELADRALSFAERGIASFSVEYLLSTEDAPSFPQNVQDVVCAARYVVSNEEMFRIDPRVMGVYGVSAGGHLAAMLGVLEGDEPILDGACGDPEIVLPVRLVMNYFGYTDLEEAANLDPEDWRVTQMLGATWDEDPELWRSASPGTYVDRGDPVFLTAHGLADTTVRPSISTAFHRRLNASGVPNTLLELCDALHGFYVHEEFDRSVRCALEPMVTLLLDPS